MFLRNSNLHIRRFEFKYLIAERKLDNIHGSIKNFVEIDKNVKNLKLKSYHVKSIYFDDLNYSSYFQKLAGLKYRQKLRLRTYATNLSDTSPVFLEIKRRDDIVVFKDRLEAPYWKVKDFIINGNYDILINSNNDSKDRFISAAFRKKVVDTVLVDYDREAYFDRNNSSFRLTLDKNISASRSMDVDLRSEGDISVIPGYSVMEIKFNRIMPAWFGMIIRAQNLERISFSKYCLSMEACGIVPRSDLPYLQWI